MSSLKKSIVSGAFWSVAGQLISLMITLGSNIWLARLLSPREFGQVGIVMFFIVLSNVFTEGGLAGALVRKKDVTKMDYSTVFCFNLTVSLFCYLLLFVFSEGIASYYNDELVGDLLKVSGIILIINAFQITQNAKLMSDMKYKRKSLYRLISVLLGSILGLIAAYNEYGVWSLIIIQISTSTILTLLLWIFEGVFFQLSFSKAAFKGLYAFGVNTTLASLLNTGFDNIYQLILGRYFNLAQVGYYYQAKKLQDVPGGIINMLTQGVVFSSLAKLQDDKTEFLKVYNKIIIYFTVFSGLMTLIVYLYAENIILILYGDRWQGAVFYMQLLIIASFFYLQELFNRVIFKVFNQTRQILQLEIVKKGIQLISIIIGVILVDLNILIIGFIITNIMNYGITFYFSRKVLGSVSYFEMRSVLKICVLGVVLVFLTHFIHSKLELTQNLRLSTLPVLLVLYFFGLQSLKIFSFSEELKVFKNVYNNKSL